MLTLTRAWPILPRVPHSGHSKSSTPAWPVHPRVPHSAHSKSFGHALRSKMAVAGSAVFTWALLACITPTAVAAQSDGSSFASRPLISLAALAALTLLPFLFMTTTSFVKISVVLSILRNALGTGQVPSGTIITGLSIILTLYVMTPVGQRIAEEAGPAAARISTDDPLAGDSYDALLEAIDAGKGPLKDFLLRNAGERERILFLDLARQVREPDRRAEVQADDLLVVLPAFLITELAEAFQIGFLVFIPFLIVDMVVANVLLALGMHMLSPTTVSLPFKLLLFVLVEGWYLLARALVLGYA